MSIYIGRGNQERERVWGWSHRDRPPFLSFIKKCFFLLYKFSITLMLVTTGEIRKYVFWLLFPDWITCLIRRHYIQQSGQYANEVSVCKTGLCVNVVHSLITLQHSPQRGTLLHSIVNTHSRGKCCCCCCCSVTRTALLMTITEESGCCFSSIRWL